ncbi:hypothetical protein AVEN_161029-1 [Araneus ventricosus]|uniref:Uncharacterized protein n=1 Tax=Araneus ventricosus TaxID=182803 RepID=A0A4Y2VD27_ARAVE|nr:hypothetical protein AVEN_161029-1 [Araneus ventricosus]
MVLTDGIPNSLKSDWKMAFLGPLFEGRGKIKVLPRLGPRDEARKSEISGVGCGRGGIGGIKERRYRGRRDEQLFFLLLSLGGPAAAHFRASVNDVRNFST